MNAIDPELAVERVNRQRQANRNYYYNNIAERSAYHKQWYEANKTRLREYYRIKAQERRLLARNIPDQPPQE